MNEAAKKISLDLIEPLVNKFITKCKLRDVGYVGQVRARVTTDINKIIKGGLLSFEYKQCGQSPRFLPKYNKDSYHTLKRIVRDESLQTISKNWKGVPYTLYDLDLKSCYASVAIGLYPSHIPIVKKALEL